MAFFESFDVRWSDLDVNRHVANTAYSNFMIAVRMSYLKKGGFDQAAFDHHRIGPAIISETFHYLKESLPESSLRVNLELSGLSEDERLVRFNHSVYQDDGVLSVFARCTFCWIDLDSRKMKQAPEALAALIRNMDRSADFHVLTKSEAFPVGLPRKKRIAVI